MFEKKRFCRRFKLYRVDWGKLNEQFQTTLTTYKQSDVILQRWHFIALAISKYISDFFQTLLLANWDIRTDPGHWRIDLMRWRIGRREPVIHVRWRNDWLPPRQVYWGRNYRKRNTFGRQLLPHLRSKTSGEVTFGRSKSVLFRGETTLSWGENVLGETDLDRKDRSSITITRNDFPYFRNQGV